MTAPAFVSGNCWEHVLSLFPLRVFNMRLLRLFSPTDEKSHWVHIDKFLSNALGLFHCVFLSHTALAVLANYFDITLLGLYLFILP